MIETDIAIADRLTHRRARIARVMAVLLFLTQGSAISQAHTSSVPKQIQMGAWVLWCCVLLVFLAFGGGWARTRRIRGLLNDETTIEHRRRSLSLGFWIAMLSCGAIWVVSYYDVVTDREAVRLIVTVSIAAALLRFASLETKSLEHG